MVTQELLKGLFHYDAETGVFTRKVVCSKRFKVGDVAGHKNDLGYVTIKVGKVNYFAHRLAWLYVNGEFPDGPIDHRNRVRSDNRIGNLRITTAIGNAINASLRRDSKTGIKGVTWDAQRKKWRASIHVNKKAINLGRFDVIEDAICAYTDAVNQYFGELVGI